MRDSETRSPSRGSGADDANGASKWLDNGSNVVEDAIRVAVRCALARKRNGSHSASASAAPLAFYSATHQKRVSPPSPGKATAPMGAAVASLRRASAPPPPREEVAVMSQLYYQPASPVLYSSPFFLRAVQTLWAKAARSSSDKFWAVDDDMSCRVQDLKQSSLITFHGPKAIAHNLNRSEPHVHVEDGARVLIYCNVGKGKYLSGTGGDKLAFTVDPTDARESDEANASCELIVRRVKGPPGGALGFGEAVCFECAFRRGYFLFALADGRLAAGKKRTSFVLATPSLKQLIQVRDQAAAAAAVASAGGSTPCAALAVPGTLPQLPRDLDEVLRQDPFAFATEEERREAIVRAERDEALFALVSQLPEELAFHVLFFMPEFLKTSRLVCKAWQRMAECRIHAIRVNGEFANLETPADRAHLVAFIRRCPNLTSLTLRNVTDLVDSEVADLFESSKLVRVALGGCSRLSDRTTVSLSKCPMLRHLNLASTAITDASLVMLAQSARHIRFLNLYACRDITPDGVLVCHALENLESINLRGTRVLLRDTVEFTRRRPTVGILTGPAVPESIYG